MSLRRKLMIWMCMILLRVGLLVCFLAITSLYSLVSSPHLLSCLRYPGKLDNQELLQIRSCFLDELHPLALLFLLLLGPPPVGFHKGRQVFVSEIFELLGISSSLVDEIYVALLRKMPIEESLRDVLSEGRMEALALRCGELTDLLLARTWLARHFHEKLPVTALVQVLFYQTEDSLPQGKIPHLFWWRAVRRYAVFSIGWCML